MQMQMAAPAAGAAAPVAPFPADEGEVIFDEEIEIHEARLEDAEEGACLRIRATGDDPRELAERVNAAAERITEDGLDAAPADGKVRAVLPMGAEAGGNPQAAAKRAKRIQRINEMCQEQFVDDWDALWMGYEQAENRGTLKEWDPKDAEDKPGEEAGAEEAPQAPAAEAVADGDAGE
jgi:hypothetical protein